MKKVAIKETIVKTRLCITPADLIELARSKGHRINAVVDIYVEVPGGGDWSGRDLEIEDDRPVIISWSETTMEEV